MINPIINTSHYIPFIAPRVPITTINNTSFQTIESTEVITDDLVYLIIGLGLLVVIVVIVGFTIVKQIMKG